MTGFSYDPLFTLILLVGSIVYLPIQCYSNTQQPTLDTVCSKFLSSSNDSQSTNSQSVFESLIGSRPWLTLVWVSCETVASKTDDEIHPPTSLLRMCEGALIRKDWILTASSCLWKCKSLNTTSITVDVGLYSNEIRKELSLGRNAVERINVERVFLKGSGRDSVQTGIPDFSNTFETDQGIGSYESFDNEELSSGDITLLRLSRSVRDKESVLPLSDCSIDHGRLQDEGEENVEIVFSGTEEGSGGNGSEERKGNQTFEEMNTNKRLPESNVTDGDDIGDLYGGEYLVSGWGKIIGIKDNTLNPNVLHDVRLEMLPQKVCREIIGG